MPYLVLVDADSQATVIDIDKSRLVTRACALKRAVAYINDNLSEVVTVRDICEQNAIPLRTLNRAFTERFGVGPKLYLKRQRLSAVRTALLTSPPEMRVADVANSQGFWHMGQFARDYKEMFGELPSETLKR
ncbi:MAG: helix-turn-helix domain-containing protein [Gammaproteobacteria bacterium]|nr:helix-turn-helix domain-containing protein [Gammaproteobacteria bacterium]